MSNPNINWAVIDATFKYKALHRKKTVFPWSLAIIIVALSPYFPQPFRNLIRFP
jgi:uncharacterized membrane protein (DUF485 family)